MEWPFRAVQIEMRVDPSLYVGSPGRARDLEEGICLEAHPSSAPSAAALDAGWVDKCLLRSSFYPWYLAYNRHPAFRGMDYFSCTEAAWFIHLANGSYFSNDFFELLSSQVWGWLVVQCWLPVRSDLLSRGVTSWTTVGPGPVLTPCFLGSLDDDLLRWRVNG